MILFKLFFWAVMLPFIAFQLGRWYEVRQFDNGDYQANQLISPLPSPVDIYSLPTLDN